MSSRKRKAVPDEEPRTETTSLPKRVRLQTQPNGPSEQEVISNLKLLLKTDSTVETNGTTPVKGRRVGGRGAQAPPTAPPPLLPRNGENSGTLTRQQGLAIRAKLTSYIDHFSERLEGIRTRWLKLLLEKNIISPNSVPDTSPKTFKTVTESLELGYITRIIADIETFLESDIGRIDPYQGILQGGDHLSSYLTSILRNYELLAPTEAIPPPSLVVNLLPPELKSTLEDSIKFTLIKRGASFTVPPSVLIGTTLAAPYLPIVNQLLVRLYYKYQGRKNATPLLQGQPHAQTRLPDQVPTPHSATEPVKPDGGELPGDGDLPDQCNHPNSEPDACPTAELPK